MEYQNSKQQGDVGVAAAIFYYTQKGYVVSAPLTDNALYDLVVDLDSGLKKIQVKTTSHKTQSGTFAVDLRTSGGNQSWNKVTKKIDQDKCDIVFIHIIDGDSYEFQSTELHDRSTVTLGLKYEGHKVKWRKTK